ncbi:UvrD-helicase domain-containing protein [Geomonas propionica]|uniref:DNA 3'-5' helicase II n=1 Tax=Geomonas propionica TaxID=2798582 RepID=A0ABS0YN16_9BACT|nr:UvrD-helicase domain-containing protein [Geomonas propionica]MBJ6799318.1 AAA family ATPase [Geomonas propionica]
MEIVQQEIERLDRVHEAIERYAVDRLQTIGRHEAYTKELEQQRLNSVDWREKNDIAEKLIEHGHHSPRKYLHEFAQQASPYFGILGIHDNDRRIGKKEYLIGNQTLMDGQRVVIIDWRKAEITGPFYEGYDIGEEYELTIRGIEREGVITRRDKVTIGRKMLTRIETPSETYELRGGEWHKNGGAVESTADTKERTEDHRMVDSIAALISPEQFRAITKLRDGVVVINGAAGAGKTTVALHRLSFLMYDAPEKYRPERCIVLMFNRVLRDYVKQSSDTLLGPVRVDTYSAWSLTALAALGVHSLKTVFDDPFGAQKKSSRVPALLAKYVKETTKIEPVTDLWRFLMQDYVVAALCTDSGAEFQQVAQRKFAAKERTVSFSDASILLRLAQLRRPAGAVVLGALNAYDHIVVDEAQDLSSLELRTIVAATSVARSLTICADEKQQILSFLDSQGFSSVIAQLQSQGLEKENLTVSYRCPKEIVDLAARVSGRSADTTKAHSGALGFHPTKNPVESMAKIRELVEALVQAAPTSLTGVICKKKADVKALHAALAGVPGLHAEGEVSFLPGVQVIHAHAIKGVEFSNVILYNPSSYDYRQTDPDRNLLYVAITRACKTLHIVHHQPLAQGLRDTASNR